MEKKLGIPQNQSKPVDSIINPRDLKRFISVAVDYWYVVVIALILSVGAGYYYFENFIDRGFGALMQISLKYNSENKKDYSDYSEEMTGINSPFLIEKTIESLNMDVSYYSFVDGRNSEELFNQTPFKITTGIVSNALFEKPITLKVIDNKSYSVEYSAGSEKINKTGVFDSLLNTSDFKLNIVKIKDSIVFKPGKLNDYIFVLHDKNDLITQYQGLLQSKLTKDLGILQVSFRDKFPKRAVSFLDTLARAYLTNTIKSQQERNIKMVQGIDRLLVSTDLTLQQLGDSLRKYKKYNSNHIETLEDQKYLSIATNLTLEKNRLEMKRVSLDEIDVYLTNTSAADATVPPPYFNEQDDAYLYKSFEELLTIQKDKREYLMDVTDKNKSIFKLDKGYDDRKGDLLKYIKESKIATDSKISYLNQQIANLAPMEAQYTSMQLRILDLERQLKVNEAMYMDLLSKKNTILVAQAGMAPEYKLFEAPHLVPPDGPGKFTVLSRFLMGGLAVSFLFLLIRMVMEQGTKSVDELKEKTQLPILGELPLIKRDAITSSIVSSESDPLASVLLRSIRTSLEFMPTKKKGKVILVTSHMIGEGKTFSAVNLAEVVSKSNKKVLLIDFDLFNPSIAKSLALEKVEIGVADIYEETSDIASSIIKGVNRFDMLLNKTALKNASELLIGEKTEKIIEYARKNYDYIILDTAPIGLISEVLSVMKYTDINVFVLSSIISNTEALKQAKTIAEENKFNLYLLLNKTNTKHKQYYSKYYKNYKYAYAS